MMKHIGRIVNTDQRCVVVYMQIPDAPEYALVIQTDTLPPRTEQAVMGVLQSSEGQGEPILANVLHRRIMPDINQNVLEYLHVNKYLQKISVDNIVMQPTPGHSYPLREILTSMGKLGNNTTHQNITPPVQSLPDISNISPETALQTANNLLIEAELLENDANKKREMAYLYAPELRPSATDPIVASKVVTKKTRKVKEV